MSDPQKIDPPNRAFYSEVPGMDPTSIMRRKLAEENSDEEKKKKLKYQEDLLKQINLKEEEKRKKKELEKMEEERQKIQEEFRLMKAREEQKDKNRNKNADKDQEQLEKEKVLALRHQQELVNQILNMQIKMKNDFQAREKMLELSEEMENLKMNEERRKRYLMEEEIRKERAKYVNATNTSSVAKTEDIENEHCR
ncbi:hypothetical protein HELRODRAFT_167789 [Helobdella robusta]|uniref:Trichohyalin-plectin-homology domain-containing protein n=1 Tax=Helobdella robusta TaxID=6412 RepID=T1EZT3_HELRO|nr:hypothetical protein HELRODRAFT_167789 [Helobdella robusta]ESO09958.1 hypothetical protein HELRODRAFT_167789 [Helobdella robusta]